MRGPTCLHETSPHSNGLFVQGQIKNLLKAWKEGISCMSLTPRQSCTLTHGHSHMHTHTCTLTHADTLHIQTLIQLTPHIIVLHGTAGVGTCNRCGSLWERAVE